MVGGVFIRGKEMRGSSNAAREGDEAMMVITAMMRREKRGFI